MRVWRISAYPGLSGTGGYHTSGRWHAVGHPVIYTSEHPALAVVEVMAHMRLRISTIPLTLKLIPIDVANDASVSPTPDLPSGWQANEPTTQAIGTIWLASNSSLLLPVPSALLAHSTNYLINPNHQEAGTHLMEGPAEAFWFDRRFLR